MIARRDLLAGVGCAAALATAEWLRPRRTLRLLRPDERLAVLIPAAFAGWSPAPGGDVVLPDVPGSLSARLYSDRIARTYRRDGSPEVMVAVAYGAAQSDGLQLHRPESCYPAVGFTITERRLVDLPLAPGVALPAAMLTARVGDRIEDIAYWTRLGEALPQTAGAQRRARFQAAVAGYVGDGILVRASAIRERPDVSGFATLAAFLRALVLATPAADRPALIGSARAAALAAPR